MFREHEHHRAREEEPDEHDDLWQPRGVAVVRVLLRGTVLNFRTTTWQKCEAVPRRARI